MKLSIFFTALVLLSAMSSPAAAERGYTFLWSGFSTSLSGRSPSQMRNAGRAARQIDGVIIPPGGIFSFNERVGARDRIKGYTDAPMIDGSGYMRDTPGGGICQLATTIYNAALYAGLEIVERHPHSRSVSYVPAGRDATISTWRKDLKLRNPHRLPLMLRIGIADRRMTASFRSTEDKPFRVEIRADAIALEPAATTAESAGIAGLREQRGGKGFSVITRRFIRRDVLVREETVSRDFYPPPSRILKGNGP